MDRLDPRQAVWLKRGMALGTRLRRLQMLFGKMRKFRLRRAFATPQR
jgi:hypothetical protein